MNNNKQLIEADIQRSLSNILYGTSEDKRKDVDLWIKNREGVGIVHVSQLWKDGESIIVGLECFGDKEKERLDKLVTDWQMQIIKHFDNTYEPVCVVDVDSMIKLNDEQMMLVKQMEELYLKMQKENIAFAMNDNGEVVVYNCEQVDDCDHADLFDRAPDGYDIADTDQMHTLFPVWTHESLCLLMK